MAGVVANYHYGKLLGHEVLGLDLGFAMVALIAFKHSRGGHWSLFVRPVLSCGTLPANSPKRSKQPYYCNHGCYISHRPWGIDGVLMWAIGWLTGKEGGAMADESNKIKT